jgi:hypothetical protein
VNYAIDTTHNKGVTEIGVLMALAVFSAIAFVGLIVILARDILRWRRAAARLKDDDDSNQ